MRPQADAMKALLNEPGLQVVPGCGDGLGARLIEEGGFKIGFASGSSISATRLAMPDMDLLTFPEMRDAVETMIAAAPKVLWLADGDTGYGNSISVQKTVRAYARAGAAAVLIEDKRWPRQLGHKGAKLVVDREEARLRCRAAVAAALAGLVLAANLPWAIAQMHIDAGESADWLAAFAWLRDRTPEPFGDARAWSRYDAPLKNGSPQPAGAWGVAIWWDRSYAMEQLSHRIPMSNGTQAGADEMARLYTETIPEAAVSWLRRSGARYVVVDPQGPLFDGISRSRLPVQLRMLGRNLDTYIQTVVQRDDDGGTRTLDVYLPTYYQTLVARLYLADGEAVDGTGPWVFETAPTSGPKGKTVELVVSSRHFDSEAEATGYLAQHASSRLTVGCLNPAKSCVSLPAVKGLKLVFSSDPLPLAPGHRVRAVKIFQVMPE